MYKSKHDSGKIYTQRIMRNLVMRVPPKNALEFRFANDTTDEGETTMQLLYGKPYSEILLCVTMTISDYLKYVVMKPTVALIANEIIRVFELSDKLPMVDLNMVVEILSEDSFEISDKSAKIIMRYKYPSLLTAVLNLLKFTMTLKRRNTSAINKRLIDLGILIVDFIAQAIDINIVSHRSVVNGIMYNGEGTQQIKISSLIRHPELLMSEFPGLELTHTVIPEDVVEEYIPPEPKSKRTRTKKKDEIDEKNLVEEAFERPVGNEMEDEALINEILGKLEIGVERKVVEDSDAGLPRDDSLQVMTEKEVEKQISNEVKEISDNVQGGANTAQKYHDLLYQLGELLTDEEMLKILKRITDIRKGGDLTSSTVQRVKNTRF